MAKTRVQKVWIAVNVLVTVCSISVQAAVIYTEAFAANDSGWEAITDFTDPIYDGSFGHLAGSIKGSLPDQFLPIPRYGGFLADSAASSGAFTGNYKTLDDFGGWSFDLFSEDEIPLTLQLVVVPESGSTFSYSASVPQTIGSWVAMGIPGTYSASWTGGDADAFTATLSNVKEIKIIFQDATDGPVSFYIDNFSNGYHHATAVPEPHSLVLFASGTLLVCAIRKKKQSFYEDMEATDIWQEEPDYAEI